MKDFLQVADPSKFALRCRAKYRRANKQSERQRVAAEIADTLHEMLQPQRSIYDAQDDNDYYEMIMEQECEEGRKDTSQISYAVCRHDRVLLGTRDGEETLYIKRPSTLRPATTKRIRRNPTTRQFLEEVA